MTITTENTGSNFNTTPDPVLPPEDDDDDEDEDAKDNPELPGEAAAKARSRPSSRSSGSADLKKALENPQLTAGQRAEIVGQQHGDKEGSAMRSEVDDASQDATGLTLPNPRIAGGAIRGVIESDPVLQTPRRDIAALYMRAVNSAVAKKLGSALREPSELGLVTKGDVLNGSWTLVDMATGEKWDVEGPGPTTLKDDRLFCNARNIAQSFVEGHNLEDFVGGHH